MSDLSFFIVRLGVSHVADIVGDNGVYPGTYEVEEYVEIFLGPTKKVFTAKASALLYGTFYET